MKKLLIALLMAAMVFVLAACSGGGLEGTWTLDTGSIPGTQDFSDLIGTSGDEIYVTSFTFHDNGVYLANVGSVHGDHVHDAEGDASGKYTFTEDTIDFGGSVAYGYVLDGDTLIIQDEEGTAFRYVR